MLTQLFCNIDDFMKEFEGEYKKRLLEDKETHTKINSQLSMSEVMTIVVFYHGYGNRTFKDFYIKTVQKTLKSAFPKLVSYNRFIELVPTVLIPLIGFLKMKRLVCSDEITFIDSTKIAVCHNKRITRNKTFEGVAQRGKSSMGWFYGFKLHIAVTQKGELCGAYISTGNTDDREIDVLDIVLQGVKGKLYADKGYISQELFRNLFNKGITLVTSIRKNMKNRLMPLIDKLLLRKRSVIETINDQLKNICDIEHTRHRSYRNFCVNMVAGLIRYTYSEKKPSINFSTQEMEWLKGAFGDPRETNGVNCLPLLCV